MKKISVILSLVVIMFVMCLSSLRSDIYALDFFESDMPIYSIYDENFNLLFERDEVEIGDSYMSNDFKYYEIIYLDKDSHKGIAKFVRDVEKPKIEKSYLPAPIKVEKRTICMYMTHNDESYVPTDGVDSVYGNGGIKDVALALKSELEKNMIDVYLNDTLHIPHDTQAYSRSVKTAKNLISQYSPDAIFDIHRDGASRKYYVTNIDGKERGRVRIVVGKANPNMKLNEEFATYLMTVGNELYPWLFTDIYYARGHYNQELSSKAILFEMGSHLCEKDLLLDSMKELSDVITTSLYNTTVNNTSGELTINGVEDKENKVINKALESKENNKSELFAISVVIILSAGVCVSTFFVFYKNLKNKNVSQKK